MAKMSKCVTKVISCKPFRLRQTNLRRKLACKILRETGKFIGQSQVEQDELEGVLDIGVAGDDDHAILQVPEFC